MKSSKIIIVDDKSDRYGLAVYYYKYSKYMLGKIAARKKHPTTYVNNIDAVLNRLCDEELLKRIFYSRYEIDEVFISEVNIYFRYNGNREDHIYLEIYNNKSDSGRDIFCFTVDKIEEEFSMVQVLTQNRDKFTGKEKRMEDIMLRYGCDQFSNSSRVNKIPGYYNHKGNV